MPALSIDVGFREAMAALGPFEQRPHIAVGVSGGPDSMALLHLLLDWAVEPSAKITALTLDHGLRPEAADEAAFVADTCADLGVDHHVLRWDATKPASGLQEAARAARRQILGQWCEANQILHLALGHHLDDQVETHVMRQMKSSGPDGLAGMSTVVPTRWGRIIRPLLGVSKNALIAHLSGCGVDFVDDPSNADRRFTRVRVRQDMTSEIYSKSLSDLSETGQLRIAQEAKTARALASCLIGSRPTQLEIDHEALKALDESAARALVAFCLARIGGQPYPPRSERLKGLITALQTAERFAGRTLGRCVLKQKQIKNQSCIVIEPEETGIGRPSHPLPASNFRVARPLRRIT